MNAPTFPNVLKTTKKEYVKFLKQKLSENREWALKGLLVLYDAQNEIEKETGHAAGHDRIGFNRIDSPVLNALAKKYLENNKLSLFELSHLTQRIPKYATQLYVVAKKKAVLEAERNSMQQQDLIVRTGRIKPGIREEV